MRGLIKEEMHPLIVLETTSPKSTYQLGWFLLAAVRESPFQASLSFWRLLAILGIP